MFWFTWGQMRGKDAKCDIRTRISNWKFIWFKNFFYFRQFCLTTSFFIYGVFFCVYRFIISPWDIFSCEFVFFSALTVRAVSYGTWSLTVSTVIFPSVSSTLSVLMFLAFKRSPLFPFKIALFPHSLCRVFFQNSNWFLRLSIFIFRMSFSLFELAG